MKKFFSNQKLVAMIICVVLCLGLITFSVKNRNQRSTPVWVQQFGNDMMGITNRIITIPTNGIHMGTDGMANLFNTYHENEKLKRQIHEVIPTQVRNQALEQENHQLKKQLKLGKSYTDYKEVNAAVLTRTPSAWQSQVTISKGENSGIKKNMPVLVDKGLVGRVIEVNRTNSKVELLTDSNKAANRFPIVVHSHSGKNVNGIVTGYDSDTNELKMGNITTKGKLKKGDRVTTNGLGGVMPKGLYIGKVIKVKRDDYGLSKEVIIKPAANLNDIGAVLVVGKY